MEKKTRVFDESISNGKENKNAHRKEENKGVYGIRSNRFGYDDFFCLITGFEAAAYGDYGFYEKEYEKYQVTEYLDMEMDDVMQVTKYMMSYLKGKEDVLSIETTVEGKTQDFFNEQDRFHMGEVQNLFLKGILLRRIAVVVLLIVVLILRMKEHGWMNILAKSYEYTLGATAVLFAILGVAIGMNFSECFTIFHEIFFDNDLWLFDARTDYMIRMLPEGFFFDMVVRIGVFFGILVILLLVIAEIIKRGKINKKNL